MKPVKPVWTGTVKGKLHIYGIDDNKFAERIGVSAGYFSEAMNGKRTNKTIKARILNGIKELEAE